MKIAIELTPAQSERLQTIAASLGVNAEEVAQPAGTDLVSAGAGDFESEAFRVLHHEAFSIGTNPRTNADG